VSPRFTERRGGEQGLRSGGKKVLPRRLKEKKQDAQHGKERRKISLKERKIKGFAQNTGGKLVSSWSGRKL